MHVCNKRKLNKCNKCVLQAQTWSKRKGNKTSEPIRVYRTRERHIIIEMMLSYKDRGSKRLHNATKGKAKGMLYTTKTSKYESQRDRGEIEARCPTTQMQTPKHAFMERATRLRWRWWGGWPGKKVLSPNARHTLHNVIEREVG